MKNIITIVIGLLIIGCGSIKEDHEKNTVHIGELMEIIKLAPLTYNATNLPDDPTALWEKQKYYKKGTLVKYEGKIYKSRVTLNKLADFSYQNLGNDIYEFVDLSTGKVFSKYTIDQNEFPQPYYDIANSYPNNVPYNVFRFHGQLTKLPNTSDVTIDLTVFYSKYDNSSVVDQLGHPVPNNGEQKTYKTFTNGQLPVFLNKDDNEYYTINIVYEDLQIFSLSRIENFIKVKGYRTSQNSPKDDILTWEDLGVENKYKAIDSSISSQTVSNNHIYMNFLSKKATSVYLFNIEAQSVNVEVINTDTNISIFNKTVLTRKKNGGSFYQYFYNDFSNINKIDFDIPMAINQQIEITINTIGDVAKVGFVGIGRAISIGGTLYGSSISMIDYSKKETNSLGEDYFKEGNYKPKNSLIIDIDSGRVDQVIQLLNSIRAESVIFKGTTKHKETQILGRYKDYNMLLNGVVKSRLNLNITSIL